MSSNEKDKDGNKIVKTYGEKDGLPRLHRNGSYLRRSRKRDYPANSEIGGYKTME